ncbi:MAG: Polysaccharide biosynthesis protein [Pedobacter sp.]|jgi:O-antigen/teichoic acid export membrane protein|nr:Polysaccharide biosynthesis protein [Pedobacter sp.]
MRIASGFISNKVVAIYTGPAGVALVGAFTNFILIVFTFANGAINTGVVKYTAEYKSDEGRLKRLFSTAFKISVYCSAVVGIILIAFGSYLSRWVFTSEIFITPVRVLGLTIILYSLNSLLISILNGKSQLRSYTIVNSAATTVGLLFTIVLVYYYKIQGALYSLVLAQSVVFFISVGLVIRSSWFSWDYFSQQFDKLIAIKLSSYSVMAIVTAFTVPLSQIILRNMLIGKVGLDGAGYWQAMMRISDGYLMIITTSLATYYLPVLASIKRKTELRAEIFHVSKIVLPGVLVGGFIIFLLRFFIIRLLYTGKFMAMEDLFIWQLAGDFFKVAGWLLSYIMLAKAIIKVYIFTELFFTLSYMAVGFWLVDVYKVQGLTIAFALNNCVYFLIMVFIFRRLLFTKSKFVAQQSGN